MLGPQTQHKGTVYGDDENAPEPGLGPHTYLLTRGVRRLSAVPSPSANWRSDNNCAPSADEAVRPSKSVTDAVRYVECPPLPARRARAGQLPGARSLDGRSGHRSTLVSHTSVILPATHPPDTHFVVVAVTRRPTISSTTTEPPRRTCPQATFVSSQPIRTCRRGMAAGTT